MPKNISDNWTKQYRKQREDLQNKINPKPSKTEREKEIKRLKGLKGIS
jgi:hypothetical protein